MGERLKATVALVTGASSGIGEATARSLAAEGATVALLARRRDKLSTLATAIGASGGKTLLLEADVTDKAQVIAAVDRLVAELGRLDTVTRDRRVAVNEILLRASDQTW